MNFINAKVLVAGRGISGLGAKTALSELGAFVTSYCDGENFVDDDYDLIVLSPSFEKSHFLYEYARVRKIKIIQLKNLFNVRKKYTVINMIILKVNILIIQRKLK